MIIINIIIILNNWKKEIITYWEIEALHYDTIIFF